MAESRLAGLSEQPLLDCKILIDFQESILKPALDVSTIDMNPLDLTPQQLKRAASIKEKIDGLNKQLRGILGAPGYIASFANEKPIHERFCEKEDCSYSKSKMGKPSTC